MSDEITTPEPGCTGAGDCPAPAHLHGCFADDGRCSEPGEHVDLAREWVIVTAHDAAGTAREVAVPRGSAFDRPLPSRTTAPDERTETVARVLHDAHWRSTGSAMWAALTPTACRHCVTSAAAVVAALDQLPRTALRRLWEERQEARADLTAARAALDRVRALPTWDTSSGGTKGVWESDLRAALDPEEPR